MLHAFHMIAAYAPMPMPYNSPPPMTVWSELIIDAAVPAALAGCVAVAATVLVERLGGRIGGLLSSVPTTIVPAAIALHSRCEDPNDFATAMTLVPIGTALNAAYLGLWLLLPPIMCSWRASARAPLAMTLATAIGAWLIAAFALILLGESLDFGIEHWRGTALAAILACGTLGVVSNWSPIAAPRGTRRVAAHTLVLRGVAAATAIGAAVILARLDIPVASGLASVFPVIFTTVMVGTWLAQGAAVPRGAAAPMMLGSTSVGVFAVLTAELAPNMGVWTSVAIAWLGSVVVVHGPAFLLLRWRTRAGAQAAMLSDGSMGSRNLRA